MGMTIDKSINGIEKRILPIYDNDADHEAIVTAISTMRKYQKIQEIMNELNGDFYGSYLKDRQTLEKIYEVIEDE